MTVDSGACDTVMPAPMAPHISLLANEMTEDSVLGKRIVLQCADVHKALLSVSKCADLGYDFTSPWEFVRVESMDQAGF